MLCTRMRLAERRYSLPRETTEGVPQTPGIIQRPCVIRNLSGNYDNFVTPRIMDRSRKLDTKKKPPLVVFSLKMQPGIKTLAQDNVKRDPRKLPTFCEQYKLIKRVRETEERPQSDLIVRGIEIPTAIDPTLSPNPEGLTANNGEYIPSELQIQLTDCCQCMRDFTFFQKELELHPSAIQQQQQQEQNNKLLIVKADACSSNDLKIVQPYNFGQKRVTTPRTRQVIKITMNTRKIQK